MKAVILAGGRGERLKPLTNVIPKALASVDGKPIIQSQIELLSSLGVDKFIVLAGYKANMITKYLKEKNLYTDTSIEVISTPAEYEPAERLIQSAETIGEEFLLVYCDNLIKDSFALKSVITSSSELTFLAQERKLGNLSIEPRTQYYTSRSDATPFVELGFMHVNSPNFFRTLQSVNSLQECLKVISAENECSTIVTQERLQSVSDMNRFNILRSNRQTILIDRDGVLNEKMPHRQYLSKWEDYRPINENLEDIRYRFSPKTDFIIITNQPGISTGEVSSEFLVELHSQMITEMLIQDISVIGLYVCTHHWNDDCYCRKPKPGMIEDAISDYQLDYRKVVYVGDEPKDMAAAQAAKIVGIRITSTPEKGGFLNFNDAYESIQTTIKM